MKERLGFELVIRFYGSMMHRFLKVYPRDQVMFQILFLFFYSDTFWHQQLSFQ